MLVCDQPTAAGLLEANSRTQPNIGFLAALAPAGHMINTVHECDIAADIDVERHFAMQAVVQKHIDNAVSKTINIPTDFPREALSDVWLRFLPELKGTTFYRWGSRENEPFAPVLAEEAGEVIANYPPDKIMRKQRTEEQQAMDCVTGVCEVPA